ncbi:MAG: 3',5'-cyclic-AMP phosphodiesterase [Gammaproteobacteria bacterium]|nr:3',5'-cyclic-AMP phosphodiesterase [Gammaproteobacteria bacterium]
MIPLKAKQNTLELIQISDPHLFADAAGSLLGVNTRDSFLATLQQVKLLHPNPDVIVVTGDISQDLSKESYQFFAHAMSQFECPVLCLAGNHDELESLEQFAVNQQISTAKQFQSVHWQILLAHSQVKGEVYGRIDDKEMQWLADELSSNPKPAIVFTHHHPVYSNAEWIDVLGIKNCEDFTQMLSQHQNVKACGFGHVHQALDITKDSVQYLSVPSTCIQFKPDSKEFAVSNEKPGYRVYLCQPDGQIKTQVYRLEAYELTLDKTATGY